MSLSQYTTKKFKLDNYKSTLQTWNKLASAYQDKFMEMDLYNDTYAIFCELIKKFNPKIFEIGCGPGNITKYLLTQRPDFKIEAIDMAPNMIQLAKLNNPSAHFKIMDCREIDTMPTKFDAIMCGFCMPYLSKEDCAKLIKDCSSLLFSDGIFYFSVIEDSYNKSGYETSSDGEHKLFIYYHEEAYLKKGLKENNFELLELIQKKYSKADGASATHSVFIAKKK